jgi:nucleotide-binding universal stress UspA family protein
VIKKILVAIDGSEHAAHALNYALDLAENYSSTVAIINVYHRVYIPYSSDFDMPTMELSDELTKAEKKQHQKFLSETLKKAKKKKPTLKISTILEEGRPADKIIETAKEGDFDLVVIGSRGLGGIKQLLLGSVSDRVADQAPCPVLIIR